MVSVELMVVKLVKRKALELAEVTEISLKYRVVSLHLFYLIHWFK
jgi:hypothetical protein